MPEPTKADLKAAVATLTADNAALRELLAAVRSYAAPPHPADYAEYTYSYEIENRLDAIAIYANGDREDMTQRVYPLVLADRAKELRERAAKPVRYAVRAEKTAEPEPLRISDETIAAAKAVADDIEAGTWPPAPDALVATWCPAKTVLDDETTVYCDRDAGHPGSHHAPGPDEGSVVAWGDEVAAGAR